MLFQHTRHTITTVIGYFLVLTCCESAQTYYVTPSGSHATCVEEPCLTLVDFIYKHTAFAPDSNITLVFLPGTHQIDTNLQIQSIGSLALRSATSTNTSNNAVLCRCAPMSGFTFEGIANVSVRGLEFGSCEGIYVRSVDQLAIENCTFRGGQGLNLAHISNGLVLRSLFTSLVGRGLTYNYTDQQSITTVNTTAGGGLVITDSNVEVVGSGFDGNTAIEGAAIFSVDSDITILTSNFTINTAHDYVGGAIGSLRSNVTIHSSMFEDNMAHTGGGAIATYLSRISVQNSKFLGNDVNQMWNDCNNGGNGGAIIQYTGTVDISNCTFINNAAGDGGAVTAFNSIIAIHCSTFVGNKAVDPNCNSQDGGDGGAVFFNTSAVHISNCTFINNTAGDGGAVTASYGIVAIHSSTFVGNKAVNPNCNTQDGGDGGAVFLNTNVVHNIISNCAFINNTADGGGGGAVRTIYSIITVQSCRFLGNKAIDTYCNTEGDGGALELDSSTANVSDCIFTNNIASATGGAVETYYSDTTIHGSDFIGNRAVDEINNVAGEGGAMIFYTLSTVAISHCMFYNNTADVGGAIDSRYFCSVTILQSHFTHNRADDGGAIRTLLSDIAINGSDFTSNKAEGNSTEGDGGAVILTNSRSILSACTFANNVAYRFGGALRAEDDSHVAIHDTVFSNNMAHERGGAINVRSSIVTSNGFLQITNNTAMLGVVYALDSILKFSGLTTISSNCGSLYAFSSNVTFDGDASIMNNLHTRSNQEGGAVTSFQSKIVFTGRLDLMYNQLENGTGGAILATESKIFTYGNTSISHNTAQYGGGVYAYQSELNFKGNVDFTHNTAIERGGGIYAVGSTIKVLGGEHQFRQNKAGRGGGIYLELTAKLYVIKAEAECLVNDLPHCSTHENPSVTLSVGFTNNTAHYGGALYVSDVNSGTCAAKNGLTTSTSECFFQALTLHSTLSVELNVNNTYFNGNSATISGATIFGGLLDRCTISPYSEILSKYQTLSQSSLNALAYLANSTSLEMRIFQTEISSEPVRICFCTGNTPECNRLPPTYHVGKGQAFNVSLVAVDQVNNPVPTTVRASLSSHDGGLGEGQDIQDTMSNCTEVTYIITSPHSSEHLVLYADGPCNDIGISKTFLEVNFLGCSCPVGFEKSVVVSNCICNCDSNLYPDYIASCSIEDGSIEKKDNIWITYINTTQQEGYLNYTHCPFDYCKPSTDSVWINLNHPKGADAQCAFNRTGMLCGSCEYGLSLSLGHSRCLSCSNNWLALLILFAIAGIALVAFLLVCNLTVAVGTINGLVFYANLLTVSPTTFFPFETPNFFTVFVAWINLDFGFVTCFFDGMDGYSKTWLQLAFPLYIIFLVAMVIIACEYTTRLARLFTKTDPVATLATLILLSYAKCLRVIIAALSSATLEYPDGSPRRLWLTDANVHYFEGKHIPLFLIALGILVLGIVYTFFLFLWQWLLPCSYRRVLKWIRHARFYPFMDAYHAPYTVKHRYWTGLLLFIRVVLYLIAALNLSGDPSIKLLSISCVLVSVLLLKTMLQSKVYKSWPLDILESSFIFNLIIFSIGTFYVRMSGGNQAALAYVSTSIAFITFLSILVYHTYAFILSRSSKMRGTLSNLIKLKRSVAVEADPPHIQQSPDKRCTYTVVDGKPDRHIDKKEDETSNYDPSKSSQVTTESTTQNALLTSKPITEHHTAIELQETYVPIACDEACFVNSQTKDIPIEYQTSRSPTPSSCYAHPCIKDIDQKGMDRETELRQFIEATL